MKEELVYELLRGKPEQLLDHFRLAAVQGTKLSGKIPFEGIERNLFILETTYTCRIRIPKYFRKIIGIMKEDQKVQLRNEFNDLVKGKGLTVAHHGYQPYSGWIELEYTTIDRGFSLKTLKQFYQQVYHLYKIFKGPFRPAR